MFLLGRVYELKANGYYPNYYTPNSSANHTTVIVGEDTTRLVNNKNANSSPPLICIQVAQVDPYPYGIVAGGNLTIKNCELSTADIAGSRGWLFSITSDSNLHLLFENCLFEHTRWAFVVLYYPNCNVTFRDCYFVNMNGYPCRRNGGVLDCFANEDTLLVENCTHIMTQGNMYSFKDFPFKRIIINHNTFINCAGYVFMNQGYQNNVSIVNNIFVNCNVQAYSGNINLDPGEADKDNLPMGLVNVANEDTIGTTADSLHFYVDKNLVYWDSSLTNSTTGVVATLNANAVDGITTWLSQMIIMNTRSQYMFDDNTKYPCLTEGTWIRNEMPAFTDTKDLFTTQLANLKAFAISTADTTSTAVLPDWRLVNTGPDKFVNPDWPIPVDLYYSDADLVTAGFNGFPVGDLNWFPVQKAAWLAQRNQEYAEIDAIMYWNPCIDCNGVEKVNSVSTEFKLEQNYPNPFNPSTTLSFVIGHSSFVSLKVYDVLGKEVATLVNEEKPAGTFRINFDASSLPSGIYFYKIQAGSFVQTKKMILLK